MCATNLFQLTWNWKYLQTNQLYMHIYLNVYKQMIDVRLLLLQ